MASCEWTSSLSPTSLMRHTSHPHNCVSEAMDRSRQASQPASVSQRKRAEVGTIAAVTLALDWQWQCFVVAVVVSIVV